MWSEVVLVLFCFFTFIFGDKLLIFLRRKRTLRLGAFSEAREDILYDSAAEFATADEGDDLTD